MRNERSENRDKGEDMMTNNTSDNKDKKGVLSEKAIERIAKKNILEKNDKYMRILAKKKEGEKDGRGKRLFY